MRMHIFYTCDLMYAFRSFEERNIRSSAYHILLIHLWGAYRCSPVPIFHSPFVNQSLCFPVPMFPDPIFPSSYVPQSLSSPTMYALCFSVSVFPKDVPQSLCSPIPLFPSPDVPLTCFQSLCSPKIFSSPYVPQSLCSTVPLSPCCHAPQGPIDWILPGAYVPQTCSPIPMFPQRVHKFLCFPVHIYTGTGNTLGEHRHWEHVWGI